MQCITARTLIITKKEKEVLRDVFSSVPGDVDYNELLDNIYYGRTSCTGTDEGADNPLMIQYED